jgi:hypothetical protein
MNCEMAEIPIACTLSPAALRDRRERLLAEIVRHATEHQELPDGYRLRFAAGDDILATILQVVEAERRCCRFLQFQITVEPDGGPISLELSGPPGTGEFISTLFDS